MVVVSYGPILSFLFVFIVQPYMRAQLANALPMDYHDLSIIKLSSPGSIVVFVWSQYDGGNIDKE